MGNKEGLTMDFAVHSHDDERTAATLTHLVEILGTISNALGTGIDFKTAPITKKPTSTSDGKALLSVLEEAVEALEKFMTTTKVSSASAMKPQDIRDETQ